MNKMTELISQVKDYIADHLDEELKRTDLAAMIYLHPDYLSHAFKDETGMSLSEYITRKRIDYAMMLLEKTNRSVSDIAAKCGYASLAYFTKTFKRIIGMSPKEYRKKKRDEMEKFIDSSNHNHHGSHTSGVQCSYYLLYGLDQQNPK